MIRFLSSKIDYSEINKDKTYVPKVGDVISTQFPGYGEMWFRAVVEKVSEKPTGTMLDIYYPQDHSYATNIHVTKVRLDGFEGIDYMAIKKHIKQLKKNGSGSEEESNGEDGEDVRKLSPPAPSKLPSGLLSEMLTSANETMGTTRHGRVRKKPLVLVPSFEPNDLRNAFINSDEVKTRTEINKLKKINGSGSEEESNGEDGEDVRKLSPPAPSKLPSGLLSEMLTSANETMGTTRHGRVRKKPLVLVPSFEPNDLRNAFINSDEVKTRTEINKLKKIFGVDKPGSAVGEERERAQRQQQLKEDNAPKKKPRKKKKNSYYKPSPEKEKKRAKAGANRAEKCQWTQEELQKNAQVSTESMNG